MEDSLPREGNDLDRRSQPREPLTELQRAVLLTVLYSDLFDYPLTEEEIARYLVVEHPDRDSLRAAVDGLLGRHLARRGDLVMLIGREETATTREARAVSATRRWPGAERFARWLAAVPFVRMAAVCGSLAVDNATSDGDVDYFCVTAPRRLWLAQIGIMLARRLAHLRGIRACPNYLLTADSLAVEPHNLYSAREIAQTVPIWGAETYAAFLGSNRWIRSFLPNLEPAGRLGRLAEVQRPRATRWLESLLKGRIGDVLDAAVHRLLLSYYPLRLRRRGWSKDAFRRFYRRDRQLVMTGGYAGSVERGMRERAATVLGAEACAADLDRLFPSGRQSVAEAGPDAHFGRLFDERYGAGRG